LDEILIPRVLWGLFSEMHGPVEEGTEDCRPMTLGVEVHVEVATEERTRMRLGFCILV